MHQDLKLLNLLGVSILYKDEKYLSHAFLSSLFKHFLSTLSQWSRHCFKGDF